MPNPASPSLSPPRTARRAADFQAWPVEVGRSEERLPDRLPVSSLSTASSRTASVSTSHKQKAVRRKARLCRQRIDRGRTAPRIAHDWTRQELPTVQTPPLLPAMSQRKVN